MRTGCGLLGLVSALLLAAAPAGAAEDDWDVEDAGPAAAGPVSESSLGYGYANTATQRFGEYNGLDEDGGYGLLDIDLNRLNPETGGWLRVTGRNLGLDSRELRIETSRQGSWGVALEYNRIPHEIPYDINTGLTGIGTDQLTTNVVVPGAGTNIEPGTTRDIVRVGMKKRWPKGFEARLKVSNEEKTGERMFGRTGIQFLVEPIDFNTRQMEAVLSFTGDRLQVSGGYYLTAFENRYTGLVVDGVTDGPNNVYSPIGLPPDNRSHHLSLSGGYSLTRTTRANFKLAYGTITQDDRFISTVTVAPGVGNNLDGRIDTLQAQLGLTARPKPMLDVRANLRYENRNDKTPVLLYYTGAGATSRTDGYNEPRDVKTMAGKVEASYRLPSNLRLTGGVDYEEIHRNASAIRSVSARDETRETAYRLEVRRSVSAVNGSLAVIHSDRGGSDFLNNILNGGGPGSNQIAPIHYSDRQRDKVRLTLDGMPSERISLQFVNETAWDRYDSRTAQILGPRKGTVWHVALDATVLLFDAWQLTAFASHDRTVFDQNGCNGSPSDGSPCAVDDLWRAELTNRGHAVGIGLHGRPGERLKAGADFRFSLDKGEYDQQGGATSNAAPMPSLFYRAYAIMLTLDYAVTPHSGVGLQVIHDRRETSDWAWNGFVYDLATDGTTVYQDPRENVTFAGVRYTHRWR